MKKKIILTVLVLVLAGLLTAALASCTIGRPGPSGGGGNVVTTVTLYLDGSVYDTLSVGTAAEIILPGKNDDGADIDWYFDEEGSKPYSASEVTLDGTPINLYGVSRAPSGKVNVAFVISIDGKTTPIGGRQQIDMGSNAVPPLDLTGDDRYKFEGYVVTGWTDRNGAPASLENITENSVFYAAYEAREYTLTADVLGRQETFTVKYKDTWSYAGALPAGIEASGMLDENGEPISAFVMPARDAYVTIVPAVAKFEAAITTADGKDKYDLLDDVAFTDRTEKTEGFSYTYKWYSGYFIEDADDSALIDGAADPNYTVNELSAAKSVTLGVTASYTYTDAQGKEVTLKRTEYAPISVGMNQLAWDNITVGAIEDRVYTGEAIIPAESEIEVVYTNPDNGRTKRFTADEIEVTYGENTTVAQSEREGAYVEISLTGDIAPAGSVKKTFAITRADTVLTAENANAVYGDAIDPKKLFEVTVSHSEKCDISFKIEGTVKNAGTYEYTITASESANYKSASATAVLTIAPFDITDASDKAVVAQGSALTDKFVYNKSAHTPSISLLFNGSESIKATCAYKDNVNAGTASVTVTADEGGNFTGSRTYTFDIQKAALDAGIIEKSVEESYTYGGDIAWSASLSEDNADKVEYFYFADGDWVPGYPLNASTYKIGAKFYGMSNYNEGALIELGEITVDPYSVTDAQDVTMQVNADGAEYTGAEITPDVTVKHGEKVLAKGTDFTAEFADNVNAGENAKATITFLGNYSGEKRATFTIAPKTLTAESTDIIVGEYAKTYVGKAITPDFEVKFGDKALTAGTDYDFEYNNNINAGSAVINVTFKGNYSGSDSAEFVIEKAKVQGTVNPAVKTFFTVNSPKAEDIFANAGVIWGEVCTDADKAALEALTFTYFVSTEAGGEALDGELAKGEYFVNVNGEYSTDNYVVEGITAARVSVLSENGSYFVAGQDVGYNTDKASVVYDKEIKDITFVTSNGETVDAEISITVDGETASELPLTVGRYAVTLSFEGSEEYGYPNAVTFTYEVTQKPITAQWSGLEFVYNGNKQLPEATLSGIVEGDEVGIEITVPSDYNAGTHTATAALTGEAAGNYSLANPEQEFDIAKASVTGINGFGGFNAVYLDDLALKKADVTAAWAGGTITGTLTIFEDSVIEYNVGGYTVKAVFTPDENYANNFAVTGGLDAALTVTAKDLSNESVSYVWADKKLAFTPGEDFAISAEDVAVSFGDRALVLGKDFDLNYETKRGVQSGTIRFIGNYTGTADITITLYQNATVITGDPLVSGIYGKMQGIDMSAMLNNSVTVMSGSETISGTWAWVNESDYDAIASSDAERDYSANAKFTPEDEYISDGNNVYASVKVTIEIGRADIADGTSVTWSKTLTYNGAQQHVTVSGIDGIDNYGTVKYSLNDGAESADLAVENAGDYAVTLTFEKNYNAFDTTYTVSKLTVNDDNTQLGGADNYRILEANLEAYGSKFSFANAPDMAIRAQMKEASQHTDSGSIDVKAVAAQFLPTAEYIGGTYAVKVKGATDNYIFDLTYYLKVKSVKIGETFYTIEDALMQGGTLTLTADTQFADSASKEYFYADEAYRTLQAGSTLILPSTSDTSNKIGEPNYNKNIKAEAKHIDTNSTYVDTTLFVEKDVILSVGGSIIVAGRLGYTGAGQSGHTSNMYSILSNDGTIILNNGANLDVRGYIKGDGLVEANKGSKIYAPFVVYDFRGGSNTTELYNSREVERIIPFNTYDLFYNIQCGLDMYFGSDYISYLCLYASSMYNDATAKLVSSSDAWFLLKDETSKLSVRFDKTAYTFDNKQVSGTNIITISGNTDLGDIKLKVVKVLQMSMYKIGFSHRMRLYIGDGNTKTNVSMPYSYKILPGGQLIIAKNATVTFSKDVIVYTKFKDTSFGGSKYPDNIIIDNKTIAVDAGLLVVNGTMILSDGASFGGKISSQVEGSQVITGKFKLDKNNNPMNYEEQNEGNSGNTEKLGLFDKLLGNGETIIAFQIREYGRFDDGIFNERTDEREIDGYDSNGKAGKEINTYLVYTYSSSNPILPNTTYVYNGTTWDTVQ